MTTTARKNKRSATRTAAGRNGSGKSATAKPAEASPNPPKEINAVVLHRVFLDDGGFSVVPEPIGDVKTTEVETILANALENWKKTIRPRKD